jgi:hypothetical protein
MSIPTPPRPTTPLVAVARLAQSRADVVGATGLPVLLALASRADDAGRSWPAMQTVADDARVSLRTARATVARLAELGLVRVARRRAEEGRQGTSIYTLDVTALMRLATAHPRVHDVPSVVSSVQELQSTSVQDVPAGELPECNERYPRVQLETVQGAGAADKQAHEQAHEQAQGRAPSPPLPSARPRLAIVPCTALDLPLPPELRAAAEAVVTPAGVAVDVDLEWAKYVADRAEKNRGVSGPDWRGWVLKAIGFAKSDRIRDSDRRTAADARRTSKPTPRQSGLAVATEDF